MLPANAEGARRPSVATRHWATPECRFRGQRDKTLKRCTYIAHIRSVTSIRAQNTVQHVMIRAALEGATQQTHAEVLLELGTTNGASPPAPATRRGQRGKQTPSAVLAASPQPPVSKGLRRPRWGSDGSGVSAPREERPPCGSCVRGTALPGGAGPASRQPGFHEAGETQGGFPRLPRGSRKPTLSLPPQRPPSHPILPALPCPQDFHLLL